MSNIKKKSQFSDGEIKKYSEELTTVVEQISIKIVEMKASKEGSFSPEVVTAGLLKVAAHIASHTGCSKEIFATLADVAYEGSDKSAKSNTILWDKKNKSWPAPDDNSKKFGSN